MTRTLSATKWLLTGLTCRPADVDSKLFFPISCNPRNMPVPTDHTAFERSINVGFVGAAAIFLIYLSFTIIGLAIADIVLGVGVLLVPAAAILTYYLSGGKTSDLDYYADQYWREKYPEWYGGDTVESGPHNRDRDPDDLATLRERYVTGDLTDDQFERKLDALLNTDTRENATEWRQSESESERLTE